MDIKDFVSFKTAKKLKSLGFDEPCRYFYENANGTDIRYTLYRYYNDKEPFCSAPMLWQAQKWIIDKGFFVEISIMYDGFHSLVVKFDKKRVKYHNIEGVDTSCCHVWYRTYNTALSAGIDAALDLITNKTE